MNALMLTLMNCKLVIRYRWDKRPRDGGVEGFNSSSVTTAIQHDDSAALLRWIGS